MLLFKQNRMWRKTRSASTIFCYGVDLNRNFDFHWMANEGASSNPCAGEYAGSRPFSEVESRLMADFVGAHAAEVRIYLALHSYGRLVVYPYGHTRDAAPNLAQLVSVCLSLSLSLSE